MKTLRLMAVRCVGRAAQTWIAVAALGLSGCVSTGSSVILADRLRELRRGLGQVQARQAEIRRVIDEVGAPAAAFPAAPAVRGAGAADPADPDHLFREGYALFHRADYAGAERVLESYLDAWPDSPHADQALYWLGESRFASGRYPEAVATFQELLRLFPQSERGPQARARMVEARSAGRTP